MVFRNETKFLSSIFSVESQFTNRFLIILIALFAICYHIMSILMFDHLNNHLNINTSHHKMLGQFIGVIAFITLLNNTYLYFSYELRDIKEYIIIGTLLAMLYLDKLFSNYKQFEFAKDLLVIFLQLIMIFHNFRNIRRAIP